MLFVFYLYYIYKILKRTNEKGGAMSPSYDSPLSEQETGKYAVLRVEFHSFF